MLTVVNDVLLASLAGSLRHPIAGFGCLLPLMRLPLEGSHRSRGFHERHSTIGMSILPMLAIGTHTAISGRHFELPQLFHSRLKKHSSKRPDQAQL